MRHYILREERSPPHTRTPLHFPSMGESLVSRAETAVNRRHAYTVYVEFRLRLRAFLARHHNPNVRHLETRFIRNPHVTVLDFVFATRRRATAITVNGMTTCVPKLHLCNVSKPDSSPPSRSSGTWQTARYRNPIRVSAGFATEKHRCRF